MSLHRLVSLGREVSALRALLAYGVAEPEARLMIAAARAAGRTQIEFRVARATHAAAGQLLRLRFMRGGHVDVFRIVDGDVA